MVARLVTAVACSLALAVVVVGAGSARSPDSAAAGCAEIIGHDPPAPYYRQPIPGAAVPASFLPNVGSNPSAAPFTFWTKAGIVIHAGSAVTVTVAPSVANRVRLTWGGVTDPAIRFSACRTGAKWN